MARELSDFIAEVKERADIVSIINRYVPLKKRGARYLGLCPFHNDHSPSFNVTPQMGIYKCFVCGEGGDIIKFMQEYEKVSFIDALKILSDELGLQLPKLEKHGRQEQKEKVSHMLDLNTLAGSFFQEQLKKVSQVKKYLEIRGINESTQNKFQLGFAPGTWDAFLQYGKKRGYSIEQMLETGLIVKGQTGKIFDRFVNRLIFPIWNQSNRIVGFGGRCLEKGGKPKYLNSPESPLYQKSKVLYGFNFARRSTIQKDTLILVEGYMDLIALYQAGITNVAAVSGTALTEYHVNIISKFAHKVILFLDGDKAGIAAVIRNLPILLKSGIEVTIPNLPSQDDPDSFIRKNGVDAMTTLLENGRTIVDFLTAPYLQDPKSYSPEAKEKLFRDCTQILAQIPSGLVRDEYLDKLCSRLKIPKQYLKPQVGVASVSANKPRAPVARLPGTIETRLLQLIISSADLCAIVSQSLELEWLENLKIRELFDIILDFFDNQTDYKISALFNGLSDMQKGIIENVVPLEIEDLNILKREVKDIIKRLEVRFLRKAMKELSCAYRNGKIERDLGLTRIIKHRKRLLELETLKSMAQHYRE